MLAFKQKEVEKFQETHKEAWQDAQENPSNWRQIIEEDDLEVAIRASLAELERAEATNKSARFEVDQSVNTTDTTQEKVVHDESVNMAECASAISLPKIKPDVQETTTRVLSDHVISFVQLEKKEIKVSIWILLLSAFFFSWPTCTMIMIVLIGCLLFDYFYNP